MTDTSSISNRVREQRLRLGLTQAQLAQQTGISRTSITAIEGDRLVPSVTAALAIARALQMNIEQLFGQKQASEEMVWATEPATDDALRWTAEVDGRLVAYPANTLPSLSILPDASQNRGSEASSIAHETLVMASCDPAAGIMASYFQNTTHMRLLALPRSSAQAVAMLREGLVHMAGLHLTTRQDPELNQRYICEQLGPNYQLVRVAKWQEGIALRSSSRLRSVGSAIKARLNWVGREPGSGARTCFNRLLGEKRKPRWMADHHRGVADWVRSGYADAGICVQLASAEAGLEFLPVQEEAYDLCFSNTLTQSHRFKAFLRVLRSRGFRELFGNLPGYDTSESGQVWQVH